jgi:hypothetical protein
MANYLAEGLNQGFRIGAATKQAKRDRELREQELTRRAIELAADRDLRREITQKGIDADTPLKSAQVANLNANAARTTARTPGEVDELTARTRQLHASAGQAETMTPLQADDLRSTTRTRNVDADLRTKLGELNMERARQGLEGDQFRIDAARRALEAGPTAEVSQKFEDGSTARFNVPLAEAQRRAAEAQYRSPYADKIAHLGDTIAKHQAEVEAGDERTGFLNIKSRKDELSRANKQRIRLQALEIQDMLNHGLISQEEADRRAARLLLSSL